MGKQTAYMTCIGNVRKKASTRQPHDPALHLIGLLRAVQVGEVVRRLAELDEPGFAHILVKLVRS